MADVYQMPDMGEKQLSYEQQVVLTNVVNNVQMGDSSIGTNVNIAGKRASLIGNTNYIALQTTTTPLLTSTTEVSTTNSNYLAKQITIGRAGTYFLKFKVKGGGGAGWENEVKFRLFYNSTAITDWTGINTSDYEEYSNLLEYKTYGLKYGDVLKLYLKGDAFFNWIAYAREFDLYVENPNEITAAAYVAGYS